MDVATTDLLRGHVREDALRRAIPTEPGVAHSRAVSAAELAEYFERRGLHHCASRVREVVMEPAA